jgi:hypothetical protein
VSFFQRREPRAGRRKIRMFCEVAAESPFWAPGRGAPMILLEELPLSEETKEALRAWNAAYDRLMPIERTPELADHEAEGHRLERLVQDELGPGWIVDYRP